MTKVFKELVLVLFLLGYLLPHNYELCKICNHYHYNMKCTENDCDCNDLMIIEPKDKNKWPDD